MECLSFSEMLNSMHNKVMLSRKNYKQYSTKKFFIVFVTKLFKVVVEIFNQLRSHEVTQTITFLDRWYEATKRFSKICLITESVEYKGLSTH